MPYLSRIWINPLRLRAQAMLRNPQVLHAAVLGGISRHPITERVLWRLELDNPHRATVLVLTESTPSWEHVIEQAGWPASDEPQALVSSYEPLLDKVQRGREFRFRLRANPTSSTRHPDKPTPAQQRHLAGSPRPRGVRVAHRTAQYQTEWLTKGAQKWGFDIPSTNDGELDVQLVARERVVFSKSGNGDTRHRVVIDTATFEGRLTVTDPDLARRSLLGGVGTARAYGCGLITLAPLSVPEV